MSPVSFMVVNTGRAASRAFYLNLKRQPGVMAFNRFHLDWAVRMYVKRNAAGPLKKLIDGYRVFQTLVGDEAALGLVFHAARRRFNYPLDHPRNEKTLRFLRDRLNLKTIFFPVRDPKRLFLSELNRSLAGHAGDWSFEKRPGNWRSSVTLEELSRLGDRPSIPSCDSVERFAVDDEEISSLTKSLSERTGKIYSLFRLFKKVFPDVYFVDYEDFLQRPQETYERMAQVAGFRFEDPSLAHTKLYGLANRILVYNPVRLCWSGSRPRLLAGRGGRHAVRYRFELSGVLELCDDWGYYDVLEVDCSGPLGEIEADLGERLCMGVHVGDSVKCPALSVEVLRHPGFAGRLLEGVAPSFVEHYKRTKGFFADSVYLREVPEQAYATFWKENQTEYEQLWTALEKGQLHRL